MFKKIFSKKDKDEPTKEDPK